MKPSAVWIASAEPAVPGAASSETAVENWAESATTVTPQKIPRTSVAAGAAPKRNPIATALAPLHAIAMIVTAVRPSRSAAKPAPMQPRPPAATTRKAPRLAVDGSSTPPAAKLATRNAGTQVHMA